MRVTAYRNGEWISVDINEPQPINIAIGYHKRAGDYYPCQFATAYHASVHLVCPEPELDES